MRPTLAAILFGLAPLPALAQAPQAWAGPGADTTYVAALEALDRGNGVLAVQLLDGVVSGFPAGAHEALHEVHLRFAEAYLIQGAPDSSEAFLGRAWAELELSGDPYPVFSAASDERLVQLIERVATAGRPELAFHLALLREARVGASEAAYRRAREARSHVVPDGVALVMYVVAPSMRRVILFTVTNGTVRAAALAVPDSLAARVARTWTTLASGSPAPSDLERLGDALVRPLPTSLLRGTAPLAVVAGGPLKAVPFDLLPFNGKPLITRHEVTMMPSASQALAQWSVPTQRLGIRVVAVGYAGAQRVAGATAVAQIREMSRYAQRAEVYVGASAKEAAIRRADLRSAALVHLAVPLRAGSSAGEVLELVAGDGDDGILTSSEAAEIRLGSPLVLLADCPDRQEPPLDGPALPAAVESFLEAGAAAVLWCARGQKGAAVDGFVRALYRQLATGKAVGAAVQAAKLARRGAGATDAEWSAFVLFGDARSSIPLRRPTARLAWWLVAAVVAGALIWVSERRLRRAAP